MLGKVAYCLVLVRHEWSLFFVILNRLSRERRQTDIFLSTDFDHSYRIYMGRSEPARFQWQVFLSVSGDRHRATGHIFARIYQKRIRDKTFETGQFKVLSGACKQGRVRWWCRSSRIGNFNWNDCNIKLGGKYWLGKLTFYQCSLLLMNISFFFFCSFFFPIVLREFKFHGVISGTVGDHYACRSAGKQRFMTGTGKRNMFVWSVWVLSYVYVRVCVRVCVFAFFFFFF